MNGLARIDGFVQNVRHGARLLWKQPGFTLLAVLVLALGIGATSAMFSLVNALLFKPLAVHQPEALVGCYSRGVAKPDEYRAFSYAEYAELRDQSEGRGSSTRDAVFTHLAAHNLSMVGLLEGDTTRRAFADTVSANWFVTFGVPLFRGRSFTAEEEKPASGIPVAIVSHSFWRRSGADPGMVGRRLHINGKPFTVVGIAPRGFTGSAAMVSPDLYLPFGMYESVINDFDSLRLPLADPRNQNLILVGRLRPGLPAATVDSRLAAIAARMPQVGARDERQTIVARRLSRVSISTSPQDDGDLRVPSILLLFLSGIVLLIASLNMANVMLVRGAARRREIAIRLALGARRRSILTQLVTEGLLLALLGGAAGLVLAAWSTAVLVRSLSGLAPFDLVVSAAPDVRVLAATGAFCLLSTLLFALGPAWNVSRPEVARDLKAGQAEMTVRGKPRRLLSRRNLLVIGQLGLSLMLLSTAGLFIRSSRRSAQLDPGFRIDDEALVEVDPALVGYEPERGRVVLRSVLDRVRAMPGVEAASLAATVPFGMVSLGRDAQRASDPVGDAADPAKRAGVVPSTYNMVDAEYFATLGIPLLRGRSFLASESAEGPVRAAVIDRLAAERLWPQGNALGQSIRLIGGPGGRDTFEAEVVGIVAAVEDHLLGREQQPHVYVPFGPAYQSDVHLHIRLLPGGEASQARLLAEVRRQLGAVDARLPVLTVRTLRQHVEGSFDLWVMRTASRMFTLFGAAAVLLAAVGLYGVRAFSVARRGREIGIRMAVGASAADAVRMVLREGLLLAAIGGGAGLLLALALGRLLGGMLYGVSGTDPLVLATSTALLAGISLVACYVPARRAARIAPMVSLRNE